MKRPVVLAPEDGSGGKLCTSCGLCCTDALHGGARLEPDELQHAETLGLSVFERNGWKFGLPCPKLVDRKCSIFHQRPHVCPSYRCRLLKRKDAGTVALPDALAVVATAHELFAAAKAAVTTGTLAQARHRALHAPVSELLARPKAERDALLQEKLRLTALDVYMDTHFREGGLYKGDDGFLSKPADEEEAGKGQGQA